MNGLFVRKVALNMASCNVYRARLWIGETNRTLKPLALNGKVGFKQLTDSEGDWYELSYEFIKPIPYVPDLDNVCPNWCSGLEIRDDTTMVKEVEED